LNILNITDLSEQVIYARYKNLNNAYHSCCLTLTLDPKYLKFNPERDRSEIIAVDIYSDLKLYHEIVPDNICHIAIELTHGLKTTMSHDEKQSLAKNLLQRYYHAKYVITTRLHVALPCLVFGVPCYFIYSNTSSDPRFDSTIVKLIGDGVHPPDACWNWTNPTISEERILLVKELANNLSSTVDKFINL
jgi:hypothetical protein